MIGTLERGRFRLGILLVLLGACTAKAPDTVALQRQQLLLRYEAEVTQLLESRRFTEAIDTLWIIEALTPDKAVIRERITRVDAQRDAELTPALARAERAWRRQNYRAAERHALEALRLAPDSDRAQAVLRAVGRNDAVRRMRRQRSRLPVFSSPTLLSSPDLSSPNLSSPKLSSPDRSEPVDAGDAPASFPPNEAD